MKTAEERQKDIEDARKALRNVIALRKEKVLYLYRAHVHTHIREGPVGVGWLVKCLFFIPRATPAVCRVM